MKFLLKVLALVCLIGLSKITKEDSIAMQQAIIPVAKPAAAFAQESPSASLLNDQSVSSARARIQKTSLRMN